MLHRRPNAPAGLGAPVKPPSRTSSSTNNVNTDASTNANTNTAYKPLRRQSSNFYPQPSPSSDAGRGASRGGARYSISQPSPGLGINTSAGGAPYGSYSSGYGNSGPGLDLNDDDWTVGAAGGWKGRLRGTMEHVSLGLRDALRLERSWNLVWSDRELRTLVLKSTMINLLSLLLLSLSSLIFSPILVHPISPTMETRTKEIGMWYNVLLSWPVFVVCFWVNASWGPSISRRAQSTLHPSHRFQPSPASTPVSSGPSRSTTPFAWIFTSITRILLISDFTLVSRAIGYIPFVGGTGAFAYMCVIDAYYFFEWNFLSKHWPLDHRIQYMQDRSAYMLGFGFPATLLTSFGPPLVKMAVFALIYPFFVLQAIQARPPTPSSSLLPSTPSPHASLPSSPIGNSDLSLNDPFFAAASKPTLQSTTAGIFGTQLGLGPGFRFRFQIPIFWLASYALVGVRWLELALARDRRGSFDPSLGAGNGYGLGLRGMSMSSLGMERSGKRAY